MLTDILGVFDFEEVPTVNGTPLILNELGTPSIVQDLFASRPAAGVAGRLFVDTTNNVIQRDDGGSWITIGSGGTVTSVDITPPAAGIGVSGGPITAAGSITLNLDNDLAALEGLNTTGFAVRTGTDTWATRTLLGTTNQITLTNGNGGPGNPTIAIANNPVFPGNASSTVPRGTTGQRPGSPITGMVRFNTTTNKLEGYEGAPAGWVNLVPSDAGLKRYDFFADQVDYPRTGQGWNVSAGAPASRDTLNQALTVRRFDDSTAEAIGFTVNVPANASAMTIRTVARAQLAPGSVAITVSSAPVETFSATSQTSHAVNLPTFSPGEQIVVALNHSPNGTGAIGTVAIPAGWIQIGTSTTTGAISDSRLTIIRRTMQGGDGSTVTVTSSNAMTIGAVAVAYQNVDTGTPLSGTVPTYNTGNSGTVTCPSVTTVSSNTRVVRVAITDAGDLTNTQPAGHTQRGWMSNNPPSNGMSLGLADISQASVGASGTATWPNNSGEEWVGASFALRADTTPAGPQDALLQLHKRAVPDNAVVGTWSTNNLTTVSLPGSSTNFQYDTTTDTLANWGITAGQTYQMQLSRNAAAGGDTLIGDLALLTLQVEFT